MTNRVLTWTGSPPPPTVAAVLAARELVVERRRLDAPDERAGIAFTRSAARLPRPCAAPGRWIWLCAQPVAEAVGLEAVATGAYDVVSLAAADALDVLGRRLDELGVEPIRIPPAAHLVLGSAASRRIASRIAQVAPTAMPVLLVGETGTGKEVMAHLLHTWSPRQRKPFVPITCAAIPNELMEAELFGYARGAFSGAIQRYDGQLVAAEGGTVLLDEIDETPLETQAKLLRVLEDRVVSRLGENVWHEVDFRLVAATNRDLRALIAAGRFGADLYERLAIVTVTLLPLRERLDDLPALARHFLDRFAREQGRPLVASIRADTLRVLSAYHWPGNIRELRNVLYEALVYKRAGDNLLPADLPKRILHGTAARTPSGVVDPSRVAQQVARGTMNLRREVAALERAALDEALTRARGNAAEAARLLGEVGRGAARDPGGTVRAMRRRLGRDR